MSFWDNVKKFAKPYADEDEYDDYDEEYDDYEEEVEESAPAPRAGRRMPSFGSAAPAAPQPAPEFNPAPVAPTPVNPAFNGHILNSSSGKQEVVLFHAKAFDDAAKAANELRSRRAIILNMENVDKALTRRVVDFLSGCVYALDGQVKKIAQSTYLFCPHSMDIVGDLESIQAEAESYV